MKLAVDIIRMDGGTQPRSALSELTINEYANSMISGEPFPPIVVFYDGESYWLADGFHRTRAAMEAKFSEIESEIKQGTLDDAKWFSFGANKGHGLRRTNEDKQRAVQAALMHPKSVNLGDRELGRHLGVSHHMVGDWRQKLSVKVSQIDQNITRTVTRGGTTYQQSIVNIGHAGVSKPEPIPPMPKAMQVPVIDRKTVWSAQVRKNFTRELLRLVRAFEKSNPPVEALIIQRDSGQPADVEIVTSQQEATA